MKQPPDRIREVIGKVIAAETGGAIVPDHRVIARHPELAENLPDALQSLRAIRAAEIQSTSAGAIGEPLTVYTDDELNAPIEADESVIDGGAAPNEINESIVGYELLEQIGRGGQAVVYRARKLSTGGVVAIKVLPGGFCISARAKARFEREAEALVRISHPNVVSVLDKGRTRAGSHFIVMAFVDGAPLDRIAAALNDAAKIAALFAKVA